MHKNNHPWKPKDSCGSVFPLFFTNFDSFYLWLSLVGHEDVIKKQGVGKTFKDII